MSANFILTFAQDRAKLLFSKKNCLTRIKVAASRDGVDVAHVANAHPEIFPWTLSDKIKEKDVVSIGKEMYQSFDTALENDTGSNIEDFKTMIKEGNLEEIEQSFQSVLE